MNFSFVAVSHCVSKLHDFTGKQFAKQKLLVEANIKNGPLFLMKMYVDTLSK